MNAKSSAVAVRRPLTRKIALLFLALFAAITMSLAPVVANPAADPYHGTAAGQPVSTAQAHDIGISNTCHHGARGAGANFYQEVYRYAKTYQQYGSPYAYHIHYYVHQHKFLPWYDHTVVRTCGRYTAWGQLVHY